jgi:hypothetical protein
VVATGLKTVNFSEKAWERAKGQANAETYMMRWMAVAALLAGLAGATAYADGWQEASSFSIFKPIDPNALADGSVSGGRASPSDFPSGMGVQTLFILPQPVGKVAALLGNWDPTRHESLGVFQHVGWTGQPSAGTFGRLKLSEGGDDWLIEQTEKAVRGEGLLNLNRQELAGASPGEEPDADAVAALWRSLLLSRAGLYQANGLSGQPACDVGGRSFAPAAEVKKLLSKIPEVSRRFGPLIGSLSAGSPSHSYWEHSKVSRHGALVLGAVHQAESQMIDIQYYVSSDYWVSITFYEFWPVEVQGKPVTLVWRGDYVITPAALGAQGIERLAAENLLLKEVKRAVAALKDDASS